MNRRLIFLLILGLIGAGGIAGWETQNPTSSGLTIPHSAVTASTVTTTATSTQTAAFASSTIGSAYGEVQFKPSFTAKSGHLVVFAGRIALNVSSIEFSLQELNFIAEKHGGYVSDSSVTPAGNDVSQAQLTIRVPADSFNVVIDDVKKLGKLSSLETSSNDVTDSYVNLNARLESSMKLLAQYQKFLNETRNVGEALAVQANIDAIQTQIDLLTAQIQQIQKQVDFATIFISLNQRATAKPQPRNALDNALGFAWGAASTEVSGLFFLTVGLSPLWVWLIPLAVLLLKWSRGRQTRANQGPKTHEER